MWSDIDARWSEIFSTSINLPRVGLSAVESSNYLQLIPLKWKFIQRKLNQLLSLKLWHLLEYAKLTEMVKQSDHTFANALNYIRLSIVDGNTNKILKVKFIDQPEENYLDTLHMYTENAPTVLINQALRGKCPYSELYWSAFSRFRTEYEGVQRISPYLVRMQEKVDQNNSKYWHFLRSETVLNNFPGQVYWTDPNDKIPGDCRYSFSVIQAARNQEQTNTGGLVKLF